MGARLSFAGAVINMSPADVFALPRNLYLTSHPRTVIVFSFFPDMIDTAAARTSFAWATVNPARALDGMVLGVGTATIAFIDLSRRPAMPLGRLWLQRVQRRRRSTVAGEAGHE